jgi:hypothetical protein
MDHLKISVVKPLYSYKNGDKTSMANYRPISVFTTFSKVREKVMYNRLSHHMQTNNILVPEKFRKDMSTEDAAFKLTDNVLKSINQKNACLRNIL